MVVIGMVIGFLLISGYAIPLPEEKGASAQEGFMTFQSSCTTCHAADRVQNYQGSSSWPEVIELMKGYGAFIQEDEEQEIIQYLENAYPR